MKRLLVTVALLLALPGAAHAKAITAVEVCGASDCATAAVSGYGHEPPFSAGGAGQPAPPAGPYYRVSLKIDGAEGWRMYYEPRSGLVAVRTESRRMMWQRLDPTLASLMKDTARQVEPLAVPSVTAVRIGSETLTKERGSYLRLFELEGRLDLPGAGASVEIALRSPVGSPWTDGTILYYPEDDVVQLAPGRFERVPAELARDIEAVRPLGAGESSFPWLVLAAALGGAAVLVIVILIGRRGALRAPGGRRVSLP